MPRETYRTPFGERLYAARTAAQLSQPELAKAVGMAQSTLAEAERSGQGSSKTAQLAAALGVRAEWLAEGTGPRHATEEPYSHYGNNASLPTMQPILAWEHSDDLPPGEYVMIPRLDVHLSAGSGKEQVEIEFVEKQPQAFRADWIRAERLKPAKLACLSASGTSMEPTIWDGDSLVVDTSQKEIIDGRVYALWYEGGERVKRLYRMPGGGLRIKSDNAQFETIELHADDIAHVRIIGRIVHRSGKGGL
jgi:phage repressor protein C with HTH and peptisase S24 domain